MRRIILSIGIPATLISFLVVSALIARRPTGERLGRSAHDDAPARELVTGARVVMPGAIVEMSRTGCVTVRASGGRLYRQEIRLDRSLERCLENYARAAVAAGRSLSDEQRALVDSLNERVHRLADSLGGGDETPRPHRRRIHYR